MKGSLLAEVAKFQIGFTRFLDHKGRVLRPVPDWARDPKALVSLYRGMMRLRLFDAKAVALQRTGRLGTYAQALGEEAVGVGVGAAMAPTDVLLPAFRHQGAQLWRGMAMHDLFAYWGGDERGSAAVPHEDWPVCITVGSQASHAAGVALAFQLRGEARAVVCTMGDGATSKGDVYEAMNMAGLWRLPVVFVVVNNQWAISLPRQGQTACQTLAQKAIAAGFSGEQVDGNDVIAVSHAVIGALAAARAGQGPRLIEALTYRLADHTTSDDASRYRDDAEVSARWAEEPLVRLRLYLASGGAWSKEDEEATQLELGGLVDRAAERYLEQVPDSPRAMFDHLFARPPEQLADQRAQLAGDAADD